MAAPVSAVGALAATTGSANSALPVTTHAVGNALVMSVKISSSTTSVIGVVGGGCVNWNRIAGPTADTEGTINSHELWLGTVAQTGSFLTAATNEIALTYSASVTGVNVDISAQEFTAFSPYTTWALQTGQAGFSNNSSSSTVTFPSLVSVPAGEIYVGHARCATTGTYTNASAGFVVQTDAASNPFIYNTNLSLAETIAPTLTNSVSAISNAQGVIIYATVVPQLAQYLPYGEGTYGPPRTYGLPIFTQYTVEPMAAASYDYDTIYVSWVQPQGAIQGYRLLSNRYGFPVDENDGNIVMESASYPGSAYADQEVIPGTYHYYGFYIQDTTGAWHRAGFTSCLAVNGFNSGPGMFNSLPAYFQNTADGAFSLDPTGDPFLIQFMNVLGWGMDYLKTQYDVLANHLNDPLFIPLDDLYNLAEELGMPFQAEIPASTMRKAVANWTHVCQERGTPTGIVNNITLLTDYGVDLRIGQNIMLEQDQSNFDDPISPAWNADISYQLNEHVAWTNSSGSFIYKCILLNSEGTSPPASGTGSNSVWQILQNVTDPYNTLANPNTVGGVNTWEVIYPNVSNGIASAGALTNGIGMLQPGVANDFQANDLRVKNGGGSGQPVYARSVSRIPADLNTITTTFAPDPQQAVLDGIPVPFTNSNDVWVSTLRYPTNSVVTWQGLPFLANRASTGATPPSPAVPLNLNYGFTAGTIGAAPPDWTAIGTGSVALTNSAAQAYMGAQSCQVAATASTNPGAQSTSFSVLPSARYQASGWAYCSAAVTVTVQIQWLDQFGNSAGTSNNSLLLTPSTWQQITIAANAPIAAATAVMQMFVSGSGITGTCYFDLAGTSCWSTPEWSLLSKDARLRLMLSAYSLNLASSNSATSIQAEWYNNHGQYVSRVGRTPSSSPGGSNYIPAGITFDSFTVGASAFLTGRNTDTDDQTWSEDIVAPGTFILGEYAGGVAYPSVVGARTISIVQNNPASPTANGWAAVTFETLASGAQTPGLVFRYQNDSNYWFANMTSLYLRSGGSYTNEGNYSTPFQPGDRIYVNLNGSTITVYRNGMAAGNQVLQISNSTLNTQTFFGIGVDVV